MSEARRCDLSGCERPARWQAIVLLWATVTPLILRTEKTAATMLTGLCVCDECRDRVKASNFFSNAESRARVRTGLARAGGAEPDFNSAKIGFVEIVDEPDDPAQLAADARRRGDPVFEA